MAWNRIQAARLLNDREMALFEGSLADQAPRMSDKELHGQIRRVRTQRDKYQDLLRRQRVATRERTGSKGGRSGMANARTEQKVQVFSEALERLEKQQSRREQAAQRPSAKPAVRDGARARPSARTAAGQAPRAARSSKAPAERPQGRSAAAPAKQARPGVPSAKRMQAMGAQRPLAHVASRGRRQQARRDAR